MQLNAAQRIGAFIAASLLVINNLAGWAGLIAISWYSFASSVVLGVIAIVAYLLVAIPIINSFLAPLVLAGTCATFRVPIELLEEANARGYGPIGMALHLSRAALSGNPH